MAFVELLLQLENEFGVTTSVDDLEPENFRSIDSIAEFVRSPHQRHGGPDLLQTLTVVDFAVGVRRPSAFPSSPFVKDFCRAYLD